MRVIDITSVANPRFKSALGLLEAKGRRQTGQFLAEGARLAQRAVAAGLQAVEAWVDVGVVGSDPGRYLQAVLPGLPERLPVFVLPSALFAKLVHPGAQADGLALVVGAPELLAERALAGDFVLVAVGTEKPGNFGAMVRSAAAAGCSGLLAAGAPIDPWNPNALRASTGAIFALPFACMAEGDAVVALQQRGFRILASHLTAAAVPHTQPGLWLGKVAVVVGPEDRGLSQAWVDAADGCVRIGMAPGLTDSLNASVAAGILCFEARRQRGG